MAKPRNKLILSFDKVAAQEPKEPKSKTMLHFEHLREQFQKKRVKRPINYLKKVNENEE